MSPDPVREAPRPRQHVRWEIDYDIHLGSTWGRFMSGLREGKILGNHAPGEDRVLVPPQPFCETTFQRATEWVEVAQAGTLEVFTVVRVGFKGGPEAPYIVGGIRLDGTSTLLMHMVGGIEIGTDDAVRDQLPRGARVRAVWSDERTGEINDIAYFEPEK